MYLYLSIELRIGQHLNRSTQDNLEARLPIKQMSEASNNADQKVKKTIYLANPYGFSEQQKRELLPLFVEALESLGLEVWEPFERNNQESILAPGWAYRIGQADIRDVADADATFAILNGIPPDEGVMVELGAAIALGKPTFLFRDDHRKVTECEEYPLNLMIFTGLPQDGWEDWYYTSFDEITSPDKALARWAKQG